MCFFAAHTCVYYCRVVYKWVVAGNVFVLETHGNKAISLPQLALASCTGLRNPGQVLLSLTRETDRLQEPGTSEDVN